MPTSTTLCGLCTRVRDATSVPSTARHACNAPGACGCPGPHVNHGRVVKPAAPLPRQAGPGCDWVGSDPTHCVTHDSVLVLVPMPHSLDTEAPVRMCRAFLAAAAEAPVPAPPRPTIVDQLAGGSAHTEATRRTLAALPLLDDETVDSLALLVLFADHPSHPGDGDWDGVPDTVRRRWRFRLRALLDALAKAAD